MQRICAPWENLCTQNESKYSETNVLPAYGNITELIEDYYLSAYLTKSNMYSWAIANETNPLSTRTPDLTLLHSRTCFLYPATGKKLWFSDCLTLSTPEDLVSPMETFECWKLAECLSAWLTEAHTEQHEQLISKNSILARKWSQQS